MLTVAFSAFQKFFYPFDEAECKDMWARNIFTVFIFYSCISLQNALLQFYSSKCVQITEEIKTGLCLRGNFGRW